MNSEVSEPLQRSFSYYTRKSTFDDSLRPLMVPKMWPPGSKTRQGTVLDLWPVVVRLSISKLKYFLWQHFGEIILVDFKIRESRLVDFKNSWILIGGFQNSWILIGGLRLVRGHNWWIFLVKITKLKILVDGGFNLMKSISEAVESNWWRKKFGEVNVANGEKLDGGGAVNFLEEYKRKFPNSSAFNSVKAKGRER